MSPRQCKSVILLIGLVVFATGCTTTEVTTYERVVGGSVDEAYLQPGADFSRYSKLYAYPLEIYYEEGSEGPSAEDLERMRSIFRTAFLTAIADDYEIVEAQAVDALGVRASLVDLQQGSSVDLVPVGGRLRSLVAAGELTFLMELSDSQSGNVLARAADRDHASVNQNFDENANPDSWAQAEAAAVRWAGLFRSFLDNNLGR